MVLVGVFTSLSAVKQTYDAGLAGRDGRTALHLAAAKGNYSEAKDLVTSQVVATDESKKTPLHSSVKHRRVAKLLLDHGADVNSADSSKTTPLHLASKGGHSENMRFSFFFLELAHTPCTLY